MTNTIAVEHNKYKAECYRCGGSVPAGEGILTWAGYEHKKAWAEIERLRNVCLVEHTMCSILFFGTFEHFQFKDRTK